RITGPMSRSCRGCASICPPRRRRSTRTGPGFGYRAPVRSGSVQFDLGTLLDLDHCLGIAVDVGRHPAGGPRGIAGPDRVGDGLVRLVRRLADLVVDERLVLGRTVDGLG